MPSAALLRKTLLSLLQEKIIPELSGSNTPLIVLAHLPPIFAEGMEVRDREVSVLKEADARRSSTEGQVWCDARMHVLDIPVLSYVVEGEIEREIGITDRMLARAGQRGELTGRCAGYIIKQPQSSYLLVPAHIPQSQSGVQSRYYSQSQKRQVTVFSVRIMPVGALCHISTQTKKEQSVSYSLLIEDAQLAPIIGVLNDELSITPANMQVVKALLLSFMFRVERGMSTRIPQMTDGLYSRFPASTIYGAKEHLSHPVVERAHEFIRLRLHESLTPAIIAEHVRLTPAQLNRILQANAGMSTMNYVARLRMESAQLLLRTSTLSVQEISQLVGYKQLSHFSCAFSRHTGQSPLKFRQYPGDDF